MLRKKHTLYFLLVLSLTACSGSLTAGATEAVPFQFDPTQGGVELPPTWTPTAIPTEPGPTPIPGETGSTGVPHPVDLLQATPVVARIDVSGWQKVEGPTASFMLPPTFEVLDMGTEFGMLMAALTTGLMEGMVEMANDLGEEFGAEPITPTPIDMRELESAFSIDFVLAMQEDQKTSAFLFSEPLEEPSTLEEQVQESLDEQEPPSEVVSIHQVVGLPHKTARVHLMATDPDTGERGQVLLYVILLDDRVYQLGYTTDEGKFGGLLPTFEASASTFHLRD